MKKILFIILASALLFAGCDTTSTDELLNGDFLPADTTPPNNQLPVNGQVVVNTIDNELKVVLSWTGKSGAKYYEIQLSTDEAFTDPLPEAPIVVNAPATSKELDLNDLDLDAGVYWWRVRASVTGGGAYSVPTRFDVRENCLYVSFPFDGDDPLALPDDSTTSGSRNNPYQSINVAMAKAVQLGIRKVKVATRGRITPTPVINEPQFAAYEESFFFKDGINLEGGWNQDFSERRTPRDSDSANFETRLEGKYGQNIIIKDLYSSTIIDGFSIRTKQERALEIQNCGRELSVIHCYILSRCTTGAMGIYITKSSSIIEDNYITTNLLNNKGDYSCIFIFTGDPVISGNDIVQEEYGLPATVDNTYGINNQGNPVLVGNRIVSGKCLISSYGVYNTGCVHPLIINNTIIAGEALGASYGVINQYSVDVLDGDELNAIPIIINNIIAGGPADSNSFGINNAGNCTKPIIINNTVLGGSSTGSYGMSNNLGAIPIAINNIFTSVDELDRGIGISSPGTETDDINYHYNCIYSGDPEKPENNYISITPDSTNVFIDPLFVSTTDFHLTVSSPTSVIYGGYDVYNDPDGLFSTDPDDANYLPHLEEYLTDIAGTARTTGWPTGSDPDNGGSGWSMGAYEAD